MGHGANIKMLWKQLQSDWRYIKGCWKSIPTGESKESKSCGDALIFSLEEYCDNSFMTLHMKNVKENFDSLCL